MLPAHTMIYTCLVNQWEVRLSIKMNIRFHIKSPADMHGIIIHGINKN